MRWIVLLLLVGCGVTDPSRLSSRRWFARCSTPHGFRHYTAPDSSAMADTVTYWTGRGAFREGVQVPCVVEPEWP